jgi:large subunit ribosomal protein L22
MQVEAITKNVRMSAQKMREVVRQIQGLPAVQARAILAVVSRKSARAVSETLSSAIANAEHIRREWTEPKLKQLIVDLQGKLEGTSDRKKKRKYSQALARYQSFLDSRNGLSEESLWVKEAVAGTATTLKRFVPKARGSAGPILKRSCHIKIVLSDE